MAGGRGGGGGGGRPYGGGAGGDSPLIMPGSPMGRPGGGGGPPGRLILPGQGGGPGGRFGGGGPGRGQQQQQQRPPVGLDVGGDADGGAGGGGGPLPTMYRPPPGFMNVDSPAAADAADAAALATADPQQLISKLRSRAGQWHSLARLLPALYQRGFDSNTIAELTGLNPAEQNGWVVAGTVYDSIAGVAGVDATLLAAFDGPDGGDRLIHFRFLPAERRAAAARHIVANGLDPPACDVLARAMKEWDRRPGERAGFSDSPGDCLAFKYLRDAIECRLPEEAAEKLALAFAAAETEAATARLAEWQQTELESAESRVGGGLAGKATLSVLRLSQDELGFRPLPQVSPLPQATPGELLDAPATSQEGAFGAFVLDDPRPGQKWVALPQWKALAMARHPVAVPLVDCAAEPAVLAASRAKTEEEKKKVTGAGLLVVDTAADGLGDAAGADPATFYLVATTAGAGGDGRPALALVDGAQVRAAGAPPVAAVLFLARPPNRESSITSSELLQL